MIDVGKLMSSQSGDNLFMCNICRFQLYPTPVIYWQREWKHRLAVNQATPDPFTGHGLTDMKSMPGCAECPIRSDILRTTFLKKKNFFKN